MVSFVMSEIYLFVNWDRDWTRPHRRTIFLNRLTCALRHVSLCMPQFLETKGIQWYDVTAQSITRLTSTSVEAGEVYEKTLVKVVRTTCRASAIRQSKKSTLFQRWASRAEFRSLSYSKSKCASSNIEFVPCRIPNIFHRVTGSRKTSIICR